MSTPEGQEAVRLAHEVRAGLGRCMSRFELPGEVVVSPFLGYRGEPRVMVQMSAVLTARILGTVEQVHLPARPEPIRASLGRCMARFGLPGEVVVLPFPGDGDEPRLIVQMSAVLATRIFTAVGQVHMSTGEGRQRVAQPSASREGGAGPTWRRPYPQVPPSG